MNFDQKEARKVIYFFLIYYGLTFVNNDPGVDAYRYALNLQANALLPFSDFSKVLSGLNSDTTVDFFEPFISFILSRITNHHSIYFAVWAIIFGFFYLKSIQLLYERLKNNVGWNSMIVFIFFILILPITFISGVRMWTAAWIFFYGAYHVVLDRNPRFLLVTMSACLVHWSFLSVNAVLLVYYLLGNRNVIYVPLALLSFYLPHLLTPFLRVLSLRLGGAYQARFSSYSSEGYILTVNESSAQDAWFMTIGSDLVFYFLIIAIAAIQLLNRQLVQDRRERNLFSFLMLFLAFVNFAMPIPSFGGRFQRVFFLFATLYVFMYFIKTDKQKLDPLLVLGLFPMLLYAAINLRRGSESISAWIFTPGFGLPFFAPVISASEVFFQ